eukprot:1053532-Pleurochrysis_carterae.AAC.8
MAAKILPPENDSQMSLIRKEHRLKAQTRESHVRAWHHIIVQCISRSMPRHLQPRRSSGARVVPLHRLKAQRAEARARCVREFIYRCLIHA